MDPNKLNYILGRVACADREELLDRLQRDELSDAEQFALRNSASEEDRALFELFRPLDSGEMAQILSLALGDKAGN